MHKRIEVIVRNPGLEGTENALGAYTLDFCDEAHFAHSKKLLGDALQHLVEGSRVVIILGNEKGEEVGVDLAYYVSHRIGDANEWNPPWWLPSHGASPREAES